MSFFRHREIFRSDVSRSAQEQRTRCSLVHRLNEFPAGYSSAGCSPTWPASASPAEFHSALQSFFRSSIIHRTANSALTGCLTSGGHPKYARKLDGTAEAHLLALACGPAPAGQAHWSLRLLADRLVELEHVGSISYETI